MLQADLQGLCADPLGPGEPIVYTSASGRQWRINVLIRRALVSPVSQISGHGPGGGAGPQFAPQTLLQIPRDATGVKGPANPPQKNEIINYAAVPGAAPADHAIAHVLTDTPGWFIVQMR